MLASQSLTMPAHVDQTSSSPPEPLNVMLISLVSDDLRLCREFRLLASLSNSLLAASSLASRLSSSVGMGGSSGFLRAAELPGRRRIAVDDDDEVLAGPLLVGDGGDPLEVLVGVAVVVVVAVVSRAPLLEASVSDSVMLAARRWLRAACIIVFSWNVVKR